jgi:EAL domain-containing protein (putative c-di-GMP-specific phosphodiesterase class I)
VFIPSAESASLIPELGCWVLQKSIEAVADWLKIYGIRLRLAVNASAIQFRTNLLFDKIKQQIELHHWDHSLVEIEIHETLLLDSSLEITTYIEQIYDYGVRLPVDDFGTGYSALSYLKNFPVSTVKIDHSFVTDLPNDHENKILVQAIIAMAHGPVLEVVAEGAETEAQWRFPQSLDCDFAQGYYFGKPMPKHKFEEYLANQGITVAG